MHGAGTDRHRQWRTQVTATTQAVSNSSESARKTTTGVKNQDKTPHGGTGATPTSPHRLPQPLHLQLGVGQQLRGGLAHPAVTAAATTAAPPPRPPRPCHSRRPAAGGGRHRRCRGGPAAGPQQRRPPPDGPVPGWHCRPGGGSRDNGDKGGRGWEGAHRADSSWLGGRASVGKPWGSGRAGWRRRRVVNCGQGYDVSLGGVQ